TAPTSTPSTTEATMPIMRRAAGAYPPLEGEGRCRANGRHRGGVKSHPHPSRRYAARRPPPSRGRYKRVQTTYAPRPSVDHLGGLRRLGPDHFLDHRAGLLLPLRKHHLVAELQTVLLGIGRELGAAEHRGDVHAVEYFGDLGLVDGAGLLDRTLQQHAGRVAARGVIAGFDLELGLERLSERGRGRAAIRLEADLRLPLPGQ